MPQRSANHYKFVHYDPLDDYLPPDNSVENPTNQRSDNPFAPPVLDDPTHYSQTPGPQNTSVESSYNQGPGYQPPASPGRQPLEQYHHLTQQDFHNNGTAYMHPEPRRIPFQLFCVNCTARTEDTIIRCRPCGEVHQQNIIKGTTLSEPRHCMLCRVPIFHPFILCSQHCDRKGLTWAQRSLIRQHQDLCCICHGAEPEEGRRRCQICAMMDSVNARNTYQRLVNRGVCTRCRRNPSVNGLRSCDRCLHSRH